MPWRVQANHDSCSEGKPYAVVKSETGRVVGCHATKNAASAQMAALYAAERRKQSADVEHFHAIMVTEGESTGLRTVTNLTWREPPFAFHAEFSTAAHGGQMTTQQVGLVTRVERVGHEIHAWGHLDLESEGGFEYGRRLVGGFSRWVSIGMDESPISMEVEMEEGDEDDDNPMAALFGRPKQVYMDGGRIGELTAVSVPAQDSATIEPTQELLDTYEGVDPEDAEVPPEDAKLAETEMPLVASSYSIEIPDLPPVHWFNEPTDVDMKGALTVTDEGRVYGYLAPNHVPHRNPMFRGATVPMGRVDYNNFLGRETIVEDGSRIVTGCLTMECGHAPTGAFARSAPASEHYDNSCSIVATVNVGENKNGVWVAGALLPDVTAGQVARMMASVLSGDWRPLPQRPGWRELAGCLLVPVPGFPMARKGPSVRYEGGELVASAVPVNFQTEGENLLFQLQQLLAESEGVDLVSQQAALVAELEGD